MHMCPTVFSLLFSNISSNNDHYISLIREVSYDSSPDTHQKYTRNCAHSLLKVCPSFSSPAFSGRAFSVAPNVSFTRRRGVGIVFNCLCDCLSVCLSARSLGFRLFPFLLPGSSVASMTRCSFCSGSDLHVFQLIFCHFLW